MCELDNFVQGKVGIRMRQFLLANCLIGMFSSSNFDVAKESSLEHDIDGKTSLKYVKGHTRQNCNVLFIFTLTLTLVEGVSTSSHFLDDFLGNCSVQCPGHVFSNFLTG